ncbi:MAG: lysophospholipid acyltransferase family protein [Pirellulales bacterium]
MKRVVDYAAYVAVRLLIAIVQALPLDVCQWATWPFVWLAADFLGIRRTVVRENLQFAFPQFSADKIDSIARLQWQHLFLMIIEIAHAQRKIHLTNWRQHVRFRGKPAIVRQLLSGRPVVLVSGHFGSFEVGGQIIGRFGFPTFTIARPLDNPFLDRFLNSFRSSNGQLVLPKRGSADRIDQLLSRGGSMVVLADQAAGRNGYRIPFFGRPASTHKAIALFALSHGAPTLVTYTRRVGKALQLEVGCEAWTDPHDGDPELADPRQFTDWFTRRLEDMVRRDPQQYWWLHRRWKERPRRKRPRQRHAA